MTPRLTHYASRAIVRLGCLNWRAARLRERKAPTVLGTEADSPYNWSRFLRAPFQFSKRAAGEAAEFSRSRVELLGVIGAARLECGEPAAEAGELIRRQLGNSFGDFFDFHVTQYSTAEAWLGSTEGRLLAR